MVTNDIYSILRKEKITALIVTHDISEAISMSDRIIVLTGRPSKIKKIYDVELTNKSTPNIVSKTPRPITKFFGD